MSHSALETFVGRVRASWGPISSTLVRGCEIAMADLARAAPSESWLARLHEARPLTAELHRDADHDFLLLAHAEHAGLYRPPHDHGRAWVVYAVQQGEIEMRTFARVDDGNGNRRLVQRDSVVLRAGQAQIYLPGDIHDTRCLTGPALLFRFTERDLKNEPHLARYAEQDDAWSRAGG